MRPFWKRHILNSRVRSTRTRVDLVVHRKFPRPVTLNFLTRFHARNPDTDSGQHALEMVLLTCKKWRQAEYTITSAADFIGIQSMGLARAALRENAL